MWIRYVSLGSFVGLWPELYTVTVGLYLEHSGVLPDGCEALAEFVLGSLERYFPEANFWGVEWHEIYVEGNYYGTIF